MPHPTVVRIDRKEVEHIKIVCAHLDIPVLILEDVTDTDAVRVRLETKYGWQLFYVGHLLATRVKTEELERLNNEQ